MTRITEQSADASYKAQRQAIDDQIGRLQSLLLAMDDRQSQDPRNWGFVGNASSTLEWLRDASQMLGGAR